MILTIELAREVVKSEMPCFIRVCPGVFLARYMPKAPLFWFENYRLSPASEDIDQVIAEVEEKWKPIGS